MELVQMARDAGAKKVLPASSSILISYFSVCFILVCFFTVHFNICFYPSSLHPSCFYSTPPFPFPLSSSPSIFLPFPFFFLFPFLFPFRLISPSSSLFPPLPSSLFLPPLSSHLNLFGFSHAGILCERSTPSTLQQRVRYWHTHTQRTHRTRPYRRRNRYLHTCVHDMKYFLNHSNLPSFPLFHHL